MTCYALADCCRLLDIDPKTLHRWLAQAQLPGIAKTIIEAIPAGIIDSALPTGALLRRTVDELDVNRLVRELGDPSKLQSAIQSALLRAAGDQIRNRLQP